MLRVLKARFEQKHRTMRFPHGPLPPLPERFAGRPKIKGTCPDDCRACIDPCPVNAITVNNRYTSIDIGRCLFCRACATACSHGMIVFSRNHQLAAARRQDLNISVDSPSRADVVSETARKMFGRSLKLRQVSAGGCNACEADTNVLGTPAWDMGRFGIQFVASPRHADGLFVTGPVSENMREALLKTYTAIPAPKIVIAAGACAINGGPFIDSPEVHNGVDGLLPVDLYIPGCPPHPITILDGMLRLLDRMPGEHP